MQARCGNGLVEADEACDDGNALFADGCDILCQVRFYLTECIHYSFLESQIPHKIVNLLFTMIK